jgi:hypothetical protein
MWDAAGARDRRLRLQDTQTRGTARRPISSLHRARTEKERQIEREGEAVYAHLHASSYGIVVVEGCSRLRRTQSKLDSACRVVRRASCKTVTVGVVEGYIRTGTT